MKIQVLLFAAFSCAFSSCFLDSGDCGPCRVVPVEANVTLADASGKVLKQTTVILKGYGINKERPQLTDENGQTQYLFDWQYNGSGEAFWVILAEETTDYQMVNLLTSPKSYNESEGTVTLRDTIKMDSLAHFKIRVKTNRTDVANLSVSALREGIDPLPQKFSGSSGISGFNYNGRTTESPVYRAIKKDFLKHNAPTSTPQLDTTFSLKVFARTGFKIAATMGFKTNTTITQNFNVPAKTARDSVFLIQF
jgi:hypothetical protein